MLIPEVIIVKVWPYPVHTKCPHFDIIRFITIQIIPYIVLYVYGKKWLIAGTHLCIRTPLLVHLFRVPNLQMEGTKKYMGSEMFYVITHITFNICKHKCLVTLPYPGAYLLQVKFLLFPIITFNIVNLGISIWRAHMVSCNLWKKIESFLFKGCWHRLQGL